MNIFREKNPVSEIKGVHKKLRKKVKKLWKNRDFMLKFLTVTMTLALLASTILPYLLR